MDYFVGVPTRPRKEIRRTKSAVVASDKKLSVTEMLRSRSVDTPSTAPEPTPGPAPARENQYLPLDLRGIVESSMVVEKRTTRYLHIGPRGDAKTPLPTKTRLVLLTVESATVERQRALLFDLHSLSLANNISAVFAAVEWPAAAADKALLSREMGIVVALGTVRKVVRALGCSGVAALICFDRSARDVCNAVALTYTKLAQKLILDSPVQDEQLREKLSESGLSFVHIDPVAPASSRATPGSLADSYAKTVFEHIFGDAKRKKVERKRRKSKVKKVRRASGTPGKGGKKRRRKKKANNGVDLVFPDPNEPPVPFPAAEEPASEEQRQKWRDAWRAFRSKQCRGGTNTELAAAPVRTPSPATAAIKDLSRDNFGAPGDASGSGPSSAEEPKSEDVAIRPLAESDDDPDTDDFTTDAFERTGGSASEVPELDLGGTGLANLDDLTVQQLESSRGGPGGMVNAAVASNGSGEQRQGTRRRSSPSDFSSPAHRRTVSSDSQGVFDLKVDSMLQHIPFRGTPHVLSPQAQRGRTVSETDNGSRLFEPRADAAGAREPEPLFLTAVDESASRASSGGAGALDKGGDSAAESQDESGTFVVKARQKRSVGTARGDDRTNASSPPGTFVAGDYNTFIDRRGGGGSTVGSGGSAMGTFRVRSREDHTEISFGGGADSAAGTFVAKVDMDAKKSIDGSRVVRDVEVSKSTINWLKVAQAGEAPDTPRYSVLKQLGTGSFGTAYLARYDGPDSKGASDLWVIKKIKVRTLREVNETLVEANNLSLLSGRPHICEFKEAFFESPTGDSADSLAGAMQGNLLFCIVMEYCSAGTIADAIQRYESAAAAANDAKAPSSDAKTVASLRPDLNQVVRWVREIATALMVMHGVRMLHRDLKPSNVFLAQDRTIKVGDFGISKALHHQSTTKSFVGTKLYMAPEVFRHRGYGSACDIWGLGCIFFELLSMQSLDRRILPDLEEEVGKLTGIPEPVLKLLKATLNTDPAKRPSAQQIVDACDKILE